MPSLLGWLKKLASSMNRQDCDLLIANQDSEPNMLELGPVVLAIIEGASSALTSRLLTRKKEPIDIRSLVDEATKDLKAKDRELQASISDIALALQSLRAILGRLPEFDVREDYKVAYRPRRDSDLGDVLYRLDEEIAVLRGSGKRAIKAGGSLSPHERPEQEISRGVPSILEGLDEEIASLRSSHSEPTLSKEQD